MEIVVDTSAIVAVLVREPHRAALVRATESADLLAPPSVHWEVGNAFSAMFKRRRLSIRAALRALEVADGLGLYAYDAYVIVCAMQHRCALLSLDRGLIAAARRAGVETLEALA